MKKSKKSPAFDLPQVEASGMREIHPLDGSLLLMHFAFRGLVAEADDFLRGQGLSRVHHRILFSIARSDALSIGGLQSLLGISKQALHKPLKLLQDEGYVATQRDPVQHRTKILRLTPEGVRIERAASDFERRAMEKALEAVGRGKRRAWDDIMMALARSA